MLPKVISYFLNKIDLNNLKYAKYDFINSWKIQIKNNLRLQT